MQTKEYTKRAKLLQELEYEFIQKLIKTRKDNKLTQASMAQKTGAFRETIARIETNKVSPSINTLINLLEPLGYTLDIKQISK